MTSTIQGKKINLEHAIQDLLRSFCNENPDLKVTKISVAEDAMCTHSGEIMTWWNVDCSIEIR